MKCLFKVKILSVILLFYLFIYLFFVFYFEVKLSSYAIYYFGLELGHFSIASWLSIAETGELVVAYSSSHCCTPKVC